VFHPNGGRLSGSRRHLSCLRSGFRGTTAEGATAWKGRFWEGSLDGDNFSAKLFEQDSRTVSSEFPETIQH
jgi:hypothetical protein